MLVPHDYWIFENAELNSAFKSVKVSVLNSYKTFDKDR